MDPHSQLIPMQPLKSETLPLTGRILIEASAGTGKTYTLSLLYLRLLLGIGAAGFPRPLAVNEILVVTFTQAATEELRYRIRANIHQLRLACLQGQHPDPTYQQLLAMIDNKSLAVQWLLLAEQQMDEAAIYTIHSFCQRMLTTHAFESGVLFEQRLVKDEQQLQLQVVSDFWRRYFNPLPIDIARQIIAVWLTPEQLLTAIQPYLGLAQLPVPAVALNDKITAFVKQGCQAIAQVKLAWCEAATQINDIILASGVSKRTYSSRNLPNWLEEINQWAHEPTLDFRLPKNLERFSQASLSEKTDAEKRPPIHPLFSQIEQLLTDSFDLKSEILLDCVGLVNQALQQEKQRRAEIGFDDLLRQLDQALLGVSGPQLAKQIAQQFPIALIDEFQDTDPIQYRIFDRIYQDRKQTGLILIGDPKQAIYAFRGADIFTYIQAKHAIDGAYSMETNWRSSQAMVTAVNTLFSQVDTPFIFSAIPFWSMQSAPRNQAKQFSLAQKIQPALQVHLLPESITTVAEYKALLANYSAEQIASWLTLPAQLIDQKGAPRPVVASDIAILVRTGSEADIMQQALLARGIASVYLSDRTSVFVSAEASDLLWLLQAVLMPENEQHLRSALATPWLGFSMAEIVQLNEDQSGWEALIETFKQYQSSWFKSGILVMLRKVLADYQVAENLLILAHGERSLTNIMHLSELLQEVSSQFDNPYALLRWYRQQLLHPDPNIDNQQQRLESDENLVKIITIHKAKGLEFPLVWLPFMGHHRISERLFYHERTHFTPCYANPISDEIAAWIDEERLAEDLRLLYVALTRAIYHCSIGLAGLRKGNQPHIQLPQTAIGYLLGTEQVSSYSGLIETLQRLSAPLSLKLITLPIPLTACARASGSHQALKAKQFHRQLANAWAVTSYSALLMRQNQQSTPLLSDHDWQAALLTPSGEELLLSQSKPVSQAPPLTTLFAPDARLTPIPVNAFDSIHQFPKGALVGTLLHELMEKIDFQAPELDKPVTRLLEQLNLDSQWQATLTRWVRSLLSAPLAADGLCLCQLQPAQRLVELPFYLPIKAGISGLQLDTLCRQYDSLSQRCPRLDFKTIEGMLKGFIDLIFEWQGRYYIIDYKSNWLGSQAADYTQAALMQAMAEHRYDLQYQLYTLALHRYLATRLTDYQYSRHVGGIYYLFLRGIDAQAPEQGIFYTRLEETFIEQLDQLFG